MRHVLEASHTQLRPRCISHALHEALRISRLIPHPGPSRIPFFRGQGQALSPLSTVLTKRKLPQNGVSPIQGVTSARQERVADGSGCPGKGRTYCEPRRQHATPLRAKDTISANRGGSKNGTQHVILVLETLTNTCVINLSCLI